MKDKITNILLGLSFGVIQFALLMGFTYTFILIGLPPKIALLLSFPGLFVSLYVIKQLIVRKLMTFYKISEDDKR